jgi:hypothetical protein
MDKQFPHLSEALQQSAAIAESLGLVVTQYDVAGSLTRNNGIRVFLVQEPTDSLGDLIHGDRVANLRTVGELDAFLLGYSRGMEEGKASSAETDRRLNARICRTDV